MTMNKTLLIAVFVSTVCVHAEELSVKMLAGERWWGLCNNFGRQMPFTHDPLFRRRRKARFTGSLR